jgi:tRNA(adenine34) deaminase
MESQLWSDVDPTWRAAAELAWESFQAGSPPVGAVVVDGNGAVIARGRSRRGENVAPPNQLVGSRLAHAEVNALAQLSIDQYRGLTLYATLEPCFLCAAAAAMSHVPLVRFAGADPMWRFVQDLPENHAELRDRWPRVEGPLSGPIGAFASLLPILDRIGRNPLGLRVEEYERWRPDLVALARGIAATGQLDALADVSVDRAFGIVVDAVTRGSPVLEL